MKGSLVHRSMSLSRYPSESNFYLGRGALFGGVLLKEIILFVEKTGCVNYSICGGYIIRGNLLGEGLHLEYLIKGAQTT